MTRARILSSFAFLDWLVGSTSRGLLIGWKAADLWYETLPIPRFRSLASVFPTQEGREAVICREFFATRTRVQMSRRKICGTVTVYGKVSLGILACRVVSMTQEVVHGRWPPEEPVMHN